MGKYRKCQIVWTAWFAGMVLAVITGCAAVVMAQTNDAGERAALPVAASR